MPNPPTDRLAEIAALEKLAKECVTKKGNCKRDWWSSNAGEDFMNEMNPAIFVTMCQTIAELREAARWIPVEERLPELCEESRRLGGCDYSKKVDVVRLLDNGRQAVHVTFYRPISQIWHGHIDEGRRIDEWTVTHWRERPAPPRAEPGAGEVKDGDH